MKETSMQPNADNNLDVRKQTQDRDNGFMKKHLLGISSAVTIGFGMLSFPVQSYTSIFPNDNTYQEIGMDINEEDVITIASVKGDSTYFAVDGFEHGFGYDLARNYANYLGKQINLTTYDSAKDALQAVKEGKADMALTTASTKLKTDMAVSSINLSCGRDTQLTKNGLHPKVSWSFANSGTSLAQSASHYLCDSDQLEGTGQLARFYNQNLLKDTYNQTHFTKAMRERLPNYKNSFKKVADAYNHDWELLVAMGYQESHLKANAVSPTGVQGLMMLTRNTAKEMGIQNRIDPRQSIQGGARYLERMKDAFSNVPKNDRIFFALASYNMGPYAVKEIQYKLKKQGRDGNSWANVYAYMSENAYRNDRYVQCMHYVSNIRSYLETIKKQSQAQSI